MSAEATGAPPVPGPGPWQSATVVDAWDETPTAKTIRLALSAPSPYLAGQHYVVRLTAPDGYQASRSYSVASAPDGGDQIDLTVERLADGEVSTFLHDVLQRGDRIEVRGPIGGWFAWRGDTPALLVGGGSGIVPLMSMYRLARLRQRLDLVHLVVSARSPEQLYYRAELDGPGITIVFSREAPAGWARPAGRLLGADIPAVLPEDVTAYVCGSSGFAEAATTVVQERGVPTGRIRIERFGPSG